MIVRAVDSIDDTPQTRSLKLRGLTTSWTQQGPPTAPLVVFLHGFPDSPEVWSPQIAALKNEYECICPYSRGLLESDAEAPRSRYSLQSQLLDLITVINHKTADQPRDVFLIGHDLGGVLALHLAPLLGPKLKGVVILNSLSLAQMRQRFKNWHQLRRSWYMFAFQVPRVPEMIIAKLPSFILKYQKTQPAMYATTITAPQLIRSVQTYRAFAYEMFMNLTAAAPRLHCPLLVLWGNRDPFLVTPTWEEWEMISDDVTFRILEAGHWLQWEKTEEVNAFVNGFIQKSK